MYIRPNKSSSNLNNVNDEQQNNEVHFSGENNLTNGSNLHSADTREMKNLEEEKSVSDLIAKE